MKMSVLEASDNDEKFHQELGKRYVTEFSSGLAEDEWVASGISSENAEWVGSGISSENANRQPTEDALPETMPSVGCRDDRQNHGNFDHEDAESYLSDEYDDHGSFSAVESHGDPEVLDDIEGSSAGEDDAASVENVAHRKNENKKYSPSYREMAEEKYVPQDEEHEELGENEGTREEDSEDDETEPSSSYEAARASFALRVAYESMNIPIFSNTNSLEVPNLPVSNLPIVEVEEESDGEDGPGEDEPKTFVAEPTSELAEDTDGEHWNREGDEPTDGEGSSDTSNDDAQCKEKEMNVSPFYGSRSIGAPTGEERAHLSVTHRTNSGSTSEEREAPTGEERAHLSATHRTNSGSTSEECEAPTGEERTHLSVTHRANSGSTSEECEAPTGEERAHLSVTHRTNSGSTSEEREAPTGEERAHLSATHRANSGSTSEEREASTGEERAHLSEAHRANSGSNSEEVVCAESPRGDWYEAAANAAQGYANDLNAPVVIRITSPRGVVTTPTEDGEVPKVDDSDEEKSEVSDSDDCDGGEDLSEVVVDYESTSEMLRELQTERAEPDRNPTDEDASSGSEESEGAESEEDEGEGDVSTLQASTLFSGAESYHPHSAATAPPALCERLYQPNGRYVSSSSTSSATPSSEHSKTSSRSSDQSSEKTCSRHRSMPYVDVYEGPPLDDDGRVAENDPMDDEILQDPPVSCDFDPTPSISEYPSYSRNALEKSSSSAESSSSESSTSSEEDTAVVPLANEEQAPDVEADEPEEIRTVAPTIEIMATQAAVDNTLQAHTHHSAHFPLPLDRAAPEETCTSYCGFGHLPVSVSGSVPETAHFGPAGSHHRSSYGVPIPPTTVMKNEQQLQQLMYTTRQDPNLSPVSVPRTVTTTIPTSISHAQHQIYPQLVTTAAQRHLSNDAAQYTHSIAPHRVVSTQLAPVHHSMGASNFFRHGNHVQTPSDENHRMSYSGYPQMVSSQHVVKGPGSGSVFSVSTTPYHVAGTVKDGSTHGYGSIHGYRRMPSASWRNVGIGGRTSLGPMGGSASTQLRQRSISGSPLLPGGPSLAARNRPYKYLSGYNLPSETAPQTHREIKREKFKHSSENINGLQYTSRSGGYPHIRGLTRPSQVPPLRQLSASPLMTPYEDSSLFANHRYGYQRVQQELDSMWSVRSSRRDDTDSRGVRGCRTSYCPKSPNLSHIKTHRRSLNGLCYRDCFVQFFE